MKIIQKRSIKTQSKGNNLETATVIVRANMYDPDLIFIPIKFHEDI